MSYPRYPEYRESGVEWLGEVPHGWGAVKLRYLASISTGTRDTENALAEGSYPFFVRSQTIESIDNFTHNCEAILTAGDGVGVGKVFHHFIGKFSAHQRVYILNKFKNVLGDFLFYYFSENFKRVALTGDAKSTVDSLRRANFTDFDVTVPPLPEQRQIAAFLDRECAAMDTLMEKQERLIELLKEKRQALISHTVTKGLPPEDAAKAGLDPHPKLKDSGIEWLGEVPEHWNVQRLRNIGRCQNGINIGAESFGRGFPFISYGDVYKNRILPPTGSGLVESTPTNRAIYSVKPGDVFFTRTSETIEEIGISSTCLEGIEDATFAGFLIRFRPSPRKLSGNFSRFYFSNILLRSFFVKEMNLITRASLSQDLLKQLPVPLPPIEEQNAIGNFLAEKDEVFQRLIDRATQAIALLKERRTALISAAVTGKIDVRSEVTDLSR